MSDLCVCVCVCVCECAVFTKGGGWLFTCLVRWCMLPGYLRRSCRRFGSTRLAPEPEVNTRTLGGEGLTETHTHTHSSSQSYKKHWRLHKRHRGKYWRRHMLKLALVLISETSRWVRGGIVFHPSLKRPTLFYDIKDTDRASFEFDLWYTDFFMFFLLLMVKH